MWFRNAEQSALLQEQAESTAAELGHRVREVGKLLRFTHSLENMRQLCASARECGISLLLDAEQSHRQPAIDYIARELMHEFNQAGTPTDRASSINLQSSATRGFRHKV